MIRLLQLSLSFGAKRERGGEEAEANAPLWSVHKTASHRRVHPRDQTTTRDSPLRQKRLQGSISIRVWVLTSSSALLIVALLLKERGVFSKREKEDSRRLLLEKSHLLLLFLCLALFRLLLPSWFDFTTTISCWTAPSWPVRWHPS